MQNSISFRGLLFSTFIFTLSLGAAVQADEQYKIGFAQDTLANDWRLAQVMETKQELEKSPNVKFIYTDGQGDTALQAKHIEDLVLQGIDLLITSPREKGLLSMIIQKVYEKGIPVVLLSRGVDGDGYSSFIHPDNRLIAQAAAEHLVKELNGKGHILMLEGIPESTTAIHRTDAFLQVIEKFPDIKVTRKVGNYLRADSIIAVESLLQQGFKFDAIYAQSDSMASGARMALQRHGVNPADITIVGIDYIKEAQQAIRQGLQSVSFTYPTGGTEGARTALKILKGEQVPKEIMLDSVKVTIENIDLVEPIF